MGYTTDFYGQITIHPPLNKEEIEYLEKFNMTRRMDRTEGPYFVDGTGMAGQGQDPDIIDFNRPDPSQPGLWCGWTVTEDTIEWDGGENFYHSAEWMKYIIDHFLGQEPAAKDDLPFLQGHICNGKIEAQGEDSSNKWLLTVTDNIVYIAYAKATEYSDAKIIYPPS